MPSTYRRNVTKSKAGHYRLTLIDKHTGLRVTSGQGWGSASRAIVEDEKSLSERLASLLNNRT